ncbi:MAG TPA: glycosyltransferase family 39 protein [Candidatus Limnocylindria bacterium]
MNAQASTALARGPWSTAAVGRYWHEAVALSVLLLAMAILALHELGALSLWRDEVASVVFAKGSLGSLLSLVDRPRAEVGLANMATYYLLLHFWLGLGESEAQIRLLSVIFGVASVVPVYFIGRRLAGWTLGALAAGIYVLIPFAVRYSQEARGYSMAMLAAGLLTWLLLIGVERRSRWPWAAYGVVAALGLYVHFFVAAVVAAHAVWLIATRQVPPRASAALALAPIVVAMVPLPFIVGQFGTEQEWIPPLSIAVISRELVALAGSQALLLTFAVLAAVGIGLRARDPRVWLMVACVVLPIALTALVSLVKPLFIGRYLVVVLPHVAVLSAAAILSLRGRLLPAAAIAILATLLFLAIPDAYADQHEQDWRGAGAWMAGQVEPGDHMIPGDSERLIRYYLSRAGAASVPEKTRLLRATADVGNGRLWLVQDATDGISRLRMGLAPDFTVISEQPFGRRLMLFLMTPTRAEGNPT